MKRFGMIVTLAALFMTGSIFAADFVKTNEFMNPEALVISVQDEFEEIETDDLPEAVTNAVSEEYEGYDIDKAYVNPVKIYKLELKNDDGTTTVYFDESGKEIEL